MDYSERFDDINKRFDHLRYYYPFFRLYAYSSRKQDVDLPYLALDVLTLLIEEGKLRGKGVSQSQIEIHVNNTLANMYPDKEIDGQKSKEIVREILDHLETDVNGEAYHFAYTDPIRKKQINHYTRWVEYEVTEGTYHITENGLDFMLNIKEVPENSKISVALILFNMQIKSGSFIDALNTVQKLNLEVLRKEDRKQELLDGVLYGGLNPADVLSQYTDEVMSQLKKEEELFNEVRNALKGIREKRDEILEGTNRESSDKDFVIIKKLSDEVEWGGSLHSHLLNEYANIPEDLEEISRIRISSLFERKYHFEESLEENIRANYSNEVHVGEMKPMLSPNISKMFSVFKIFEPQSIDKKTEEKPDIGQKEEWSNEKSDEELIDEVETNVFVLFSKVLFDLLESDEKIRLSTFFDMLQEQYGMDVLTCPNLLPYLLILNAVASNDYDGIVTEEDTDTSYPPVVGVIDLEEVDSINKSGECKSIHKALFMAKNKFGFSYNKLRIVSFHNKRIYLTEEKDAHISDMIFTAE